MVDFTNKKIFKLKEVDTKEVNSILEGLLIDNEKAVRAFSSMRDKLVFTDKIIISINVQGLTGSKKDYTSIPYSKIQTYSIETAGVLDLDAELDITISGLGTVRFELKATSNIISLSKMMSEKILK